MAAIIPIPDIICSFDIIPEVLIYEIVTYYVANAKEYTTINTLNKLFHNHLKELEKNYLTSIRPMYFQGWSDQIPNKRINNDGHVIDMDFYPASTMIRINRCTVCYKCFQKPLCQIIAKSGLMDTRASIYVVCDNFDCRMHIAMRFAKYCHECNIVVLKKSIFQREAFCIRSSGEEQKCFFVTDWLYHSPAFSKLVENDEFDDLMKELSVPVYWFDGTTRFSKNVPIANVPQKSYIQGEYERVKSGNISIWEI